MDRQDTLTFALRFTHAYQTLFEVDVVHVQSEELDTQKRKKHSKPSDGLRLARGRGTAGGLIGDEAAKESTANAGFPIGRRLLVVFRVEGVGRFDLHVSGVVRNIQLELETRAYGFRVLSSRSLLRSMVQTVMVPVQRLRHGRSAMTAFHERGGDQKRSRRHGST